MIFNNLAGLYALLALIPFILIYLIRPKSFERTIPSLMFLMQEKTRFRKASFLQKLLRNLLFIMQIIIILSLAFSVASPHIEIPHTVMVRNNVIVLDSSASMNTRDGVNTRFSNAVSKAKDNLGMKNTIILAENTPVIVLEDARSGEALDFLNKLTPKATSTNLGDSILLAGDLLGKNKGVVNVISDFISTEGSDLLVAKRSLTAKGNTVNFVDVNSKADNVGIIDIAVDKDETIVDIKNYKDEQIGVEVELMNEEGKISENKLELLANSKEKITFKTPEGISRITLNIDDDLALDNTAYISTPQKKDTRVLLITNSPDTIKIKAALNALGVDLEIREPPAVNAYNVEHDIVIVDDITKRLFVPTDFVDLKKYVGKGGILIITAQEDLAELNTLDLLPITINSTESRPTTACVDIIGEIFPKDPFSSEPCFSTTNKYLKATSKNGTTTLISAQIDNSPLAVYATMGQGQILYYGIMDKYSDFYSDPLYPVFWNNMINYLLKLEGISSYNYKSGKIVIINEREVKTPTARITTNRLLLDESGIYGFDGKKIAVNLASEKESNINRDNIELKGELEKFSAEKLKDVDDLDLEVPLLIAAIVILFLEFVYIKRRGDL